MPVGTDALGAFCHAAELAPEELYWAGRATLVRRQGEIEVYDRVFREFFGAAPVEPPRPRARLQLRAVPDEATVAVASDVELLRRKSFARCSPEELRRLGELIARLPLVVPERRSRRRVPSRAGVPDLRRTLRRSFRSGGEPVERAWRARQRKRRRLVLLLDVSGSMADYSRPLLVFAHAALRAGRGWEAFCFGTRLTRVTRALARSDPDEALARASEEVFDWHGGTRIGESVKSFLDEHGHAGLARGAVVVICSDGLEVGDPELLGEQMARLGRLAHRVVWLNPLKADPAYEPLARGMQAALPHVDVFESGHSLVSLEDVWLRLAAL
jgi:uncharacterized protein with von Willebrand factor type A (vWA) domain